MAYKLSGGRVDFNHLDIFYKWVIDFIPIDGVKVVLVMDHHSKKIGIKVYVDRYFSYYTDSDLNEHIRKNVGVMVPRHSHLYNCLYDFKYNNQNCDRIIKILIELLIYFNR